MEQLLKILENNARLPVEDIATMLNKSPAEVAAMMDLARAQGIIKGYKTLVDWEKAKVNRVEAVIELNVSPKKSRGFDEIAATIAAFDEVESDTIKDLGLCPICQKGHIMKGSLLYAR